MYRRPVFTFLMLSIPTDTQFQSCPYKPTISRINYKTIQPYATGMYILYRRHGLNDQLAVNVTFHKLALDVVNINCSYYVQVAWVRVSTQTILSIHHRMVTENARITLSYNDHRTWFLHIRNVQETDRGWYMCQINTEPMTSQKGYLQVVGMIFKNCLNLHSIIIIIQAIMFYFSRSAKAIIYSYNVHLSFVFQSLRK